MRWKSLAIIIVLNMFGVLFFSVIYEYISLADRFRQIEDTIYPAMESALEASTAGEEMFSDKSDANMFSNATSSTQATRNSMSKSIVGTSGRRGRTTTIRNPYDTVDNLVQNGVMIYDRKTKNIEKVDTYKLAIYYGINGQLPADISLLEQTGSIYDLMDTSTVFSYLYGGVGSDYNNPNLHWANRNSVTKRVYSHDDTDTTIPSKIDEYNQSDARRVNDSTFNAFDTWIKSSGLSTTQWAKEANNFKAYFDNAGSKVYSYTYMKKKDGDNFDIVASPSDTKAPSYFIKSYDTVFPTLVQMGLKLDNNYNMPTSSYMLDNFCSSLKVGKKTLENTTNNIKEVRSSYYFLTPYSLGVTYVPMSVFKPVFTSVLDANIRLRKVASGESFDSSVFEESDGCVRTNVYATDPNVPDEHNYDSVSYTNPATNISNCEETSINTEAKQGKEFIVNDGYIEYDLNSIKCKVDYLTFDIFNDNGTGGSKNGYITTALIGTKIGSTDKSGTIENATMQSYNNSYNHNTAVNTYYNVLANAGTGKGNVSGQRLVAKVTTKVKIHVPYRSAILQWACKRNIIGGAQNHYGIKLWDAINNNIVTNNDNLWYECEAYYSNVR